MFVSVFDMFKIGVLSCVDGSVYARFFSTDVDRYEERSCVRPVGAVYITAGLDEVRVPGP